MLVWHDWMAERTGMGWNPFWRENIVFNGMPNNELDHWNEHYYPYIRECSFTYSTYFWAMVLIIIEWDILLSVTSAFNIQSIPSKCIQRQITRCNLNVYVIPCLRVDMRDCLLKNGKTFSYCLNADQKPFFPIHKLAPYLQLCQFRMVSRMQTKQSIFQMRGLVL